MNEGVESKGAERKRQKREEMEDKRQKKEEMESSGPGLGVPPKGLGVPPSSKESERERTPPERRNEISDVEE
eukprot:3183702-Karenia_brevis.AAC.1